VRTGRTDRFGAARMARPRGAPPENPAKTSRSGSRHTPIAARGEPYVWLTGGGLAVATCMILGLLLLVLAGGLRTFWPRRIVELTLADGAKVMGEITRTERYRPDPELVRALDARQRQTIEQAGGWSRRRLVRTGNFDLYGEDFRWVPDHEIVSESFPPDAWMIERREWGPAIGRVTSLLENQIQVAAGSTAVALRLDAELESARAIRSAIADIEKDQIGALNHLQEQSRLETRRAALQHGEGSAEHRRTADRAARQEEAIAADFRSARQRIEYLAADIGRIRLVAHETAGRLIPESASAPETPIQIAQIMRAYPANTLNTVDRLGVYLDRWREFLVEEPREANTEGGVFPAIFGTFMMTVIMSLAVAPFGIIAALYLREYARQGPLVSSVRIAVNNLAGVPSIVFGVFGLGFFCYFLGGRLDQIFFPERLPSPTFGTGGILWASLTLALLTVPVVIVATEEALAAVPRSMREGSYACGASKWQTIRRIVLPRATPGIMTGLILAMARGAGEVAPLMITGVVKLAPELPFDGRFPYLHLERSFMHLGFHIYDVGFQSRNSEAGKPMVFTTTLLLIMLVVLLNLTAITLRARLKRRFKPAHF